MHAYRAGETGAFEELYRRHSGQVYAYLKRRVSSREEVDEIFQAAFFKVHRSRHKFDFKFPFAQWLYVITKTALLDHFRKQGRSVPLANSEVDLSQIEGAPALDGERDIAILR